MRRITPEWLNPANFRSEVGWGDKAPRKKA